MAKKVGYIRARYPETRNIINKAAGNPQYVQIAKFHNNLLLLSRAREILMGKLLHRLIKLNWNKHAVYKTIVSPKVDVIHTFNAVCDTNVPWVATFESAIPRTNQTCTNAWQFAPQTADDFTAKAFALLRKDSCKALIAISEATRNMQLQLMDAFDIEGREEIENKIIVLHPPQTLLITDEEAEKKFDNVNNCVEIIFVGGKFFRKGGAEVVDSLMKLATHKQKFHLTVISTLDFGDDVSRSTYEDMLRYKQILTSTDWITYYERLPNPEVLELCKKSHIGLLPTMADTYGYSVLEMQACGCPVITTDIRALPEMNNNDCGYLINVPKVPSGEAVYRTDEELAQLKQVIFDGLHSSFAEILDNPGRLKDKSAASIQKIKNDHSPEKYGQKLAEIYKL